jgi:bifunctional UDP-N-acetylglucosamine pyrophosphorylase/glucosamine-1-phosphate N-acetyltransferase
MRLGNAQKRSKKGGMSDASSQGSLATTSAIILAAGQGTRMKSGLPKVLHEICGRPLVHYPVRAALDSGCKEVVVVVGHGRDKVQAYLKKAFGERVKTALQETQKGTGDAAKSGLLAVSPDCDRAIIYVGDAPLLLPEDIAKVGVALDSDPAAAIAMATCVLDDPTGYGRILRDAMGQIVEIREHRDLLTDAEKATREMNPAIYAASVAFLREAIQDLKPVNAQGEYYLTDIVKFAVSRALRVIGVPSRADVVMGINDRQQLVEADALMSARLLKMHRVSGVTVRPGARIDDGVVVGRDAVIETGVVLRGDTVIGERAIIDVGCVLTNVKVEEGALVKPYSVGQDSFIGKNAQVGPFSHLRPESTIGEDAHIGNFVETKKTTLGRGAKANHLAYLGDGIIGEGANIGAGTIFCNYDGFQKHTTRIEKGAFIGSDSQLVAPITIGEGAYVATGTTVTRDVPADALAISRPKQENKDGYAGKLRARMKAAKEAAAAKK